MNDESTKPRTRRELLRGFGRGAALSAVACAAAVLGARSGRRPRLEGQTCVNNGVCRGCPAFDDCGLPLALSAKRAGMKQ